MAIHGIFHMMICKTYKNVFLGIKKFLVWLSKYVFFSFFLPGFIICVLWLQNRQIQSIFKISYNTDQVTDKPGNNFVLQLIWTSLKFWLIRKYSSKVICPKTGKCMHADDTSQVACESMFGDLRGAGNSLSGLNCIFNCIF